MKKNLTEKNIIEVLRLESKESEISHDFMANLEKKIIVQNNSIKKPKFLYQGLLGLFSLIFIIFGVIFIGEPTQPTQNNANEIFLERPQIENNTKEMQQNLEDIDLFIQREETINNIQQPTSQITSSPTLDEFNNNPYENPIWKFIKDFLNLKF